MNFSVHQFMCPICGKETIPVARRTSHQRFKGHRKWLYCPWCHKQVNTYECRNEEELMDFRAKFETGEISQSYEAELASMNPKYRHT